MNKKGARYLQEFPMRLPVASLAIGVLLSGSAFAQYVISAHSGVVQSVDGSVYLNGQPVQQKFGQFPEIKENQEFRTEEGRAEILLTPGAFLRMGENSSIRMVSNKLTDTRVEVLSGSVMVECDDVQKNEAKDNVIMLLYHGNTMLLEKHGLYRVDADPSRFQVFEGEAVVKGESGQVTLKSGKQTALTGALMAENFDKKAADDLYLWSSQRSSYLAKASASSAMTLHNASGGSYSPWQFNPMFGMFTFVPYGGIAYSPFGYGFWSPYAAFNYFPYYGYPSGYGGYSGGRSVASFSARSGNASRLGSGSPASRGYSAPSGGFSGGGGQGFGGGGASMGGGGGASMGGGGGHMSGGGGAHGR
jgi:hypothetical protein